MNSNIPNRPVVVMTSINSPTDKLQEFSEMCVENEFDLIVVGDEKSPADYRLRGANYWSLERQESLPWSLKESLPLNSYSRKNLAYLIAIQEGAEYIVETDDDNFPTGNFWKRRQKNVRCEEYKNSGWFNVYLEFSDGFIWPRGFPLIRILDQRKNRVRLELSEVCAPIQQGLVHGDPDVDAIFRLTQNKIPSFNDREPVALGEQSWCPFNSQNTTWFPSAFPLLYLPSYCTFRMTDIWRSFVAQRIAWEYGWSICFRAPDMIQKRNPHNLMVDFEGEVSGYLKNEEICDILNGVGLSSSEGSVSNNLMVCYDAIVTNGFLPPKELDLVRDWLEALNDLSGKSDVT
ncbi:MAG: DUF288 domain-containing protein [Cyanothece sp. SIO1E1]|nr:DUF288 domain-containing protein [Cyanothece sp. SIO1E1]